MSVIQKIPITIRYSWTISLPKVNMENLLAHRYLITHPAVTVQHMHWSCVFMLLQNCFADGRTASGKATCFWCQIGGALYDHFTNSPKPTIQHSAPLHTVVDQMCWREKGARVSTSVCLAPVFHSTQCVHMGETIWKYTALSPYVNKPPRLTMTDGVSRSALQCGRLEQQQHITYTTNSSSLVQPSLYGHLMILLSLVCFAPTPEGKYVSLAAKCKCTIMFTSLLLT